MTDAQVYGAAATLGSIAGMRSMSAPMIVSRMVHDGVLPAANPQLEFLGRAGTVTTTTVLAAGELIADKLPFTPSRTAASPLFARIVSGALCGAAVTSATRRSLGWGILIGAAAAVGATFAAYHLRKAADEGTGLPDAVFAVAEDAIVAASGVHTYRAFPKAETGTGAAQGCGRNC